MNAIRQRLARQGDAGASPTADSLGFPFTILLIWMLFEFGRPPRPMGIPLMISLVSVALWAVRKEKRLGKHGFWWFVILAAMVVQVPFARNNYSAYVNTRVTAILFLTVCLPMLSVLTNLRRVRAWVYTLLGVAVYVGAWAALHGGFGPAGAAGAQDENYVAALMTMALPFAFFKMMADRRTVAKLLLGGAIIIFVAAIALADNASRGGFLALCAVALYCFARSPRKKLGIGVLAVAALALAAIAGPAFWAEIETTGDYQSGTGDLRIQAWTAGLRAWMAHPILGVGPGNFPWVLGQYQSARQLAELGRSLEASMVAHSFWVELLVELGIVGFVATVVLMLTTWRRLEAVQRDAKRLVRERSDPRFTEIRCYAHATQGAMIAIAVNGVVLSLLYFAHLWLLIVLGSAMPFVLRGMVTPPAVPGERRRASRHRPHRGPPVSSTAVRSPRQWYARHSP